MKIFRYLVAGILAGCSNDGLKDGIFDDPNLPLPPPPPPPPLNELPGGVWNGTRPSGTSIIVLISESGKLRVVDPFGNQGFGQVRMDNVTEISADYHLAPPFGGSLIDGSDSATCRFDGTVEERVSIDYDVSCLTSLGETFGGSVLLTYDPAYDMDSSLARIAGNYDVQGEVLTIDVDGVLFMQSSQSGCVWNGRVGLMHTDWNLYGMTATSENCQGAFAPIAGASWDGMVTILTAPGAEALVGGITAEVDGLPVSNVLALPRL